jgi:hypothetical protein
MRLSGAIALCIWLAGCSGYTRYGRAALVGGPPVSETGTSVLAAGRKVKIETTEGRELKGVVEAMSDTSLVVDAQEIQYSRMEAVWVRSFLWMPTLAVAATTAMVYAIVSLSAGPFSTNSE